MILNIARFLPRAEHRESVVARSLRQSVLHWLELQQLRHKIRKEREQLAALPDHLLRDIGVSRADAEAESRRSFEDIPAGRSNCW
ncbi:MAG: DUF1127 domain-containing protein [Thiolinea sp.]